ncbi:transmembrane protein 266 isoform X1 [Triplophysa dalaica]|uniref:transmembrane protein 266 isoform X1 n=1 Tax=Triplophysa dalaica TaxID=1582913 RepID=UPI0024DFA873|nr:transmembrane protein 266 isoform X1 [Triplophysa dalaica]XP_056595109.1 transmembrane protein 266 isoform X1 [Triplophysa dalaica]XP_056595110.1 transmembrane protein 266 isoform X1 [Triplophysa dalaica]
MSQPQPHQQAAAPDLEVISQQVDDEGQCMAPVQLVSFAYRDLPLAALDLSLAGSQLLSNLDEDENQDGSNWLKPCCGRRAALWQVCLLSAGFNCFLVACVILVVLLLTLELLIDTKLLQFNNAFQFACIIHWISLVILSVFFTETVFRIVVLGIWDYIENKVEVFDGAVIVLSLAPMVASTVANGPSSPWDAISLIITLRIWRVKRIIDAYVLQVKVEMEMEIQQYEKTKAVREEQLERLTQICQEQAFEIRQLRAHLAQQDLDLAAEREAAMQIHHVWGKQSTFQEIDGLGPAGSDTECRANTREPRPPPASVVQDDMNNYISQYYSEPSSDIGVPNPGARIITMAAIDVHLPTNPNQLPPSLISADGPGSGQDRTLSEASSTTMSRSSCSFTARQHSISSHTLGSTTDCSSTVREASTSDYSGQHCSPPPYCSPLALGMQPGVHDPSAVVKELLSSLSEDSCLAQKGRVDPVNLKLPSPAGSVKASPELEHRVKIYNKRNQERLGVFQTKPLIHLQGTEPSLEEKYRLMEPADTPLSHIPDI